MVAAARRVRTAGVVAAALALAFACAASAEGEAAAPAEAAPAADAADPAEAVDAARLYAGKCAQCHGRTGRGAGSYPKLAGREAAYLEQKVSAYRAGIRSGPNSPLMIQAVRDLSDAEIAALAAYIAANFP